MLVGEGLATREPNRGVHVVRGRPRLRARRLPGPVGARGGRRTPLDRRLRGAAGRGPVGADRLHRSRSGTGASYQQLNEKHLAIHRSLVGLLDSPRLVATAEALSAELRLALAQIDRIRRNAHDQAGSHNHLLDLLEHGDVEAAVTEIEAPPRRRRGGDPRRPRRPARGLNRPATLAP